MKTDKDFMRRCLELGGIALENGDAPVGSVIVFDEQIIAEATESVKSKNDPSAHAELLAVRIACEKLGKPDLSGATLFSNVEPCVMRAYAIATAKVKAAENALKTREPERVALAYTESSVRRNSDELFMGRKAVKRFPRRKWKRKLDYHLMKSRDASINEMPYDESARRH